MEIYQFPTRGDNFGVLLHDPASEAIEASGLVSSSYLSDQRLCTCLYNVMYL